MTALSPKARELIDEAEVGFRPSSTHRHRLKAAVFTQIAAAGGASTAAVAAELGRATSTSATGAHQAMSGSATMSAKWLLAVLALGTAVSVVYVVGRSNSSAALALSVADETVEPASQPTRARFRIAMPQPGIAASSAPSESKHRRPAPPPRRVRLTNQPAAAGPAATAAPDPARVEEPASDKVAKNTAGTRVEGDRPRIDEVSLINGARTALRRSDIKQAAVYLDAHAQDYPGGMLADERDVLRIAVLCQSRALSAARRAADRFLERRPDSPLVGVVESSCGRRKP